MNIKLNKKIQLFSKQFGVLYNSATPKKRVGHYDNSKKFGLLETLITIEWC